MLLGLRSRGGRKAGREGGEAGGKEGTLPARTRCGLWRWQSQIFSPRLIPAQNRAPPHVSPQGLLLPAPQSRAPTGSGSCSRGAGSAQPWRAPRSAPRGPAPEDLGVLDVHGGESWGRSSGAEPLWVRAPGPAACAAAGLCCCSSVNQHPAEPGPPAAPRTAARHSLALLLSCHPDPLSSPRAGLCGDLQPHRLTPGPLAAPSSVRWLTAAEQHPAAPLPPAPLRGFGCTTRLCLERSPLCGTQHPHGTGWVRSGAPVSAHKLPRSGRFGRLGAKATAPIPRGCGNALPLRAEVITVCRQN